MKSVLLFTLVGTGLFGGTVTGLLAVQGRLNFEGTRGIPVVESLFAEPPADEAAAAVPHVNTEELEAAAHPAGPPGAQSTDRVDGLGREHPFPRETGPAITRDAADGLIPQGRTELEERSGDRESPAGSESADQSSFGHKAESLMGQGQYRRGKLFDFPRLESGLSIAELDEMVASAQDLKKDLERGQAALDQREADLAVREADLQDRERAVLEKMRDVMQQRTVLEEEIASFQESYTLVRGNEVQQFKSYAEMLAGLDTEKSSQIITQWWETEDGRTKAIKILKMMPQEATEEIFAVLSAEQTKEILDRLAGAVVERQK